MGKQTDLNKIVITFTQVSSTGYHAFPNVNYGFSAHSETVLGFSLNLLSEPNNYGAVQASFYVRGRADDGIGIYINGQRKALYSSNVINLYLFNLGSFDSCSIDSHRDSFNLTQQNNSFAITVESKTFNWWGEVFEASVTVTTTSK